MDRPYKMIRRIGRFVFYQDHVYKLSSYNKAKQKFATLANVQNKRRLRYSWIPITIMECDYE